MAKASKKRALRTTKPRTAVMPPVEAPWETELETESELEAQTETGREPPLRLVPGSDGDALAGVRAIARWTAARLRAAADGMRPGDATRPAEVSAGLAELRSAALEALNMVDNWVLRTSHYRGDE